MTVAAVEGAGATGGAGAGAAAEGGGAGSGVPGSPSVGGLPAAAGTLPSPDKAKGVLLAIGIVLFWLAGLAFFIALEGGQLLGEQSSPTGGGMFKAIVSGLGRLAAQQGAGGAPAAGEGGGGDSAGEGSGGSLG